MGADKTSYYATMTFCTAMCYLIGLYGEAYEVNAESILILVGIWAIVMLFPGLFEE